MADSSWSPARENSILRAWFHKVEADGVRVFYCQAGPSDAPVQLLLHGYPRGSHLFEERIPADGDAVSRDRFGTFPILDLRRYPENATTNIRLAAKQACCRCGPRRTDLCEQTLYRAVFFPITPLATTRANTGNFQSCRGLIP